MPSDEDEVLSKAFLDILPDLDDEMILHAVSSGEDMSQLVSRIHPLISSYVLQLDVGLVKITEIDEYFFTSRKAFMQQFGLMMFPFFTFFDSLMERFALELYQAIGTGGIVGLMGIINPKENEKKVAEAYQRFSASMQDQLVGMEHEGAEPFVSQISLFLQNIEEIPIVNSNAAKEKNSFLFKVQDAHRQLFLSEGENWEDSAMTAMGDVLGRLAITSMPTQKNFLTKLKKIRPANMKKQVESFILVQRGIFHENFLGLCQPIYQQTIDTIAKAWQKYSLTYQQRVKRCKNFLLAITP